MRWNGKYMRRITGAAAAASVIGLAAALSGDVITMAVAWITMFSVAKLLQKFGASSGFGGMVSRTAQAGQSFVSLVRSAM